MANEDSRSADGAALIEEIFGKQPALSEFPPVLRNMKAHTESYLFGDIWRRDGLSLQERSMITIAMLAGLGKDRQLRVHLEGGLRLGFDSRKLEELMIHVAHYAGWPCAMTGLYILSEVLEEMGMGASTAPKSD